MTLESVGKLKVPLFLLLFFFMGIPGARAGEALTELERGVLVRAGNLRSEVIGEFESFIRTDRLDIAQLFDTFYIPVPGTTPQKFSTRYDAVTDEVLRIILDKYLAMDERYIYAVVMDRNGYVPTHNTKYSKPLTGDVEYNTRNNRAKQIFNDRTGLAAARNRKPFLIQTYTRDTGEVIHDLSLPIYFRDKHWGAVRMGYRSNKETEVHQGGDQK